MTVDWSALGATLAKAVVAYVALIALVRLTGNRTLAKLRAFDFVVTIALGSVLASTIVSPSVPLLQGLAAMATLILLQFVVAWTSTRSARASRLVTNQPILLYHEGAFLEGNLKKARVTDDEVRSAMRAHGHGRERDVQTVVLETDGQLAVLPRNAGLESLKGPGA